MVAMPASRTLSRVDEHLHSVNQQLRTESPPLHALRQRQPPEEIGRHNGHSAGHLVREPQPTSARLDHLTADEAALYRDLVEDASERLYGWSRSA